MAAFKAYDKENDVLLTRTWAMPNKNTFSIKPVKELIEKYKAKLPKDAVILDPFANSNKHGTITNDLDTQYDTDYHMDAKDFLGMFDDNSVDMVLFDPPYSPHQISVCYKQMDRAVSWQDVSASFWSKQKDEIARILKPGGITICFGWHTNGVGKKRNFKIIEIVDVAHGGNHNDTLATVEFKNK